MNLANRDIREAIARSGIAKWRIADRYGITDSNFSRLLRKELNEEKRARILQIIEEISNEEHSHEG